MPDANFIQGQCYLVLGGEPASAALMGDLELATIESSLHLPDVATLVVHDPRLHWVDHASLECGVSLRISARFGPREEQIFDGEIVEIEPEYTAGTQRLIVRAFDRLHRLARIRTARSFQNVSDSDLVQQLAGEANLSTQVDLPGQVHPYAFQANETNLAFLQRRAAALGAVLYVDGTVLHCAPPSDDAAPIELVWGDALFEFRPRMTTIGQVAQVTARGWDPIAKQSLLGKAKEPMIAPKVGARQRGGQRNGGVVASDAFGIESALLIADRPLSTQTSADHLAQAAAERRAGRFVEAEGICIGMPTITAGVRVSISAVGDRFSGSYFVTGATHTFSQEEGYRTSFAISGLTPATFLGLFATEQEPMPSHSLAVGIITDNNDPEKLGRVKLMLPWLAPDHASDWTRVASPGAGRDRGIQFLPEVDDEVLVGFELGDPQHLYVLGGLWNGIDGLASTNAVQDGKIQRRVIVSRTGHTITLDDDDGNGSITIKDRAGNTVTLDSNGKSITISSQGDLSLAAKGKLAIKGDQDITLDATGKLSITGKSITVDGGPSVSIQGSMIDLN